jgi:hypothetical protein
MSRVHPAQIAATAALLLAIALMLTILAGRAVAANEEDNFPDWIFRCDGHGDVYIYEGYSTFTIRGAEPPFQLGWSAEKVELVLTVKDQKCELIYPVEQN